jgi:sodium-dependent dicarboxylate transporter 2/3/5
MLFGGGISLGTQMFDTGLAGALGKGFVELTGVHDVWMLTLVAIVFTIFFTEVCSNTATSNMLVPLVIGVTTELGVSPVPPALGVGLAASCAFMMPIATGPNAIVYGTGRVGLMDMVRAGLVLNLLCGGLIFGILRVLCPLMGWM